MARAKSTSFLTLLRGRRSVVEVVQKASGLFAVSIDGVESTVDSVEVAPGNFSLLIDDRPFVAEISGNGEKFTVDLGGQQLVVQLADAAAAAVEGLTDSARTGPTDIRAMMPGRVVAVLANPGEEVKKGAGVLVVEAMKMENEVTAPSAGKIVDVRVELGQTVETGQVLAVME